MRNAGSSGYRWWETWLYARFALPTMALHHRHLLRQLIDEAPPGAQCLDVGCGNGAFLAELIQNRPDLRLFGMDASSSATKAAAGKRIAQRLHIVRSAAESLPFPEASFDVIIATGVIKHCRPPEVALAEFQRVLRPGGRLLLYEMDPTASGNRFTGLVTSYPWVAQVIIRRCVLPQSLSSHQVRVMIAPGAWHIESDHAVVDLPLYSFALRRMSGATGSALQ